VVCWCIRGWMDEIGKGIEWTEEQYVWCTLIRTVVGSHKELIPCFHDTCLPDECDLFVRLVLMGVDCSVLLLAGLARSPVD